MYPSPRRPKSVGPKVVAGMGKCGPSVPLAAFGPRWAIAPSAETVHRNAKSLPVQTAFVGRPPVSLLLGNTE